MFQYITQMVKNKLFFPLSKTKKDDIILNQKNLSPLLRGITCANKDFCNIMIPKKLEY